MAPIFDYNGVAIADVFSDQHKANQFIADINNHRYISPEFDVQPTYVIMLS